MSQGYIKNGFQETEKLAKINAPNKSVKKTVRSLTPQEGLSPEYYAMKIAFNSRKKKGKKNVTKK